MLQFRADHFYLVITSVQAEAERPVCFVLYTCDYRAFIVAL